MKKLFCLFINCLVLFFLMILPFLIAFVGAKKVARRKQQNKSIWGVVFAIIILFLFSLSPMAYLLISQDVLGFFMIIIIEYYLLSVLIPWGAFGSLLILIIKNVRPDTTKRKKIFNVLSICLIFILIFIGTFTGFFFNMANEIMGASSFKDLLPEHF